MKAYIMTHMLHMFKRTWTVNESAN